MPERGSDGLAVGHGHVPAGEVRDDGPGPQRVGIDLAGEQAGTVAPGRRSAPSLVRWGEQTAPPAALTTSDANPTLDMRTADTGARSRYASHPMVGDILQPTHLLFILVVALLVLGPKRLPEVGRSLGSGLRDFKAAINGESHEDHEPRAYVEPEPDPVAPHEAIEPAGFDLGAGDSVRSAASEYEPATPSALHDHHLDPHAEVDDLHAPAALEDLHPPAESDDLQATGLLHPPAADADLPESVASPEPDPEPVPVAAASSSGFASALASSRQRPGAGGEPTADDE
jgi:sec-independent protein translocase protein TatA